MINSVINVDLFNWRSLCLTTMEKEACFKLGAEA